MPPEWATIACASGAAGRALRGYARAPVLEALDLTRTLDRNEYASRFPPLQETMRRLQYALREAEIPTVVLFEGWDAAGKGTIIQRLTERLDPRAFRAYPGAAPSDLERRYHWLWRYQVRLPEDGQIALFDHSWYARVLVERVEKVVPKRVWSLAYEQIAQFERWLVDDGQVLVKFFFHVSQREQRRRLRRMEADARQRWKVQPEDWRRNHRYARWMPAIEEMIARTDRPGAPWTLVEATDARWARVRVFETIVSRMEQALARREAAPADVSRTHLAADAMRAERRERAREERQLVRHVAEEAGLPLDEDDDKEPRA
jgi:polyphosphate kinase 2 (PPK2 family)